MWRAVFLTGTVRHSLSKFFSEKDFSMLSKPIKAHRYFRPGDIVRNKEVWGKKLFVIHGLGGNDYLPELYVHPLGEKPTVGNSCNWDARSAKLIQSTKRPLKKLKTELLIRLLKKGNIEARREFILRNRKI